MANSPHTTSIVLGNSETDSGTVTGNSMLGSPAGSVSFYFCGPTASAQSCTSETHQVGSALTLTAGAGGVSFATSCNFHTKTAPKITGFSPYLARSRRW
jgi:hypothetical protein